MERNRKNKVMKGFPSIKKKKKPKKTKNNALLIYYLPPIWSRVELNSKKFLL